MTKMPGLKRAGGKLGAGTASTSVINSDGEISTFMRMRREIDTYGKVISGCVFVGRSSGM
jgi:hypothetical protein